MAAEQEDKYKAEKLGQLTAVSMLMIGRALSAYIQLLSAVVIQTSSAA